MATIERERAAGTAAPWRTGAGLIVLFLFCLCLTRRTEADVGFLHFLLTLDERGLIESVSETTGHPA